MDSRERPLVISHHPCLDGFTASWAAWLKYPEADFHHGVHGEPPPDVKGRHVYLLDFSYKRPVLEAMADDARRIVVIDHHKTAEADLKDIEDYGGGTVSAIFDMNKSGARLAWEWFHPRTPVPLMVRMVEDRDLWRWSIPGSKAVNANLFSHPFDFDDWNEYRITIEDPATRVIFMAEGEAITRRHEKDVKELVDKLAYPRQFKRVWAKHPFFVPCANLPYTMSSDAAGMMAESAPFAATYYQDASGYYVFSLRSREGGADVSQVAAVYGGGGHAAAAGFRIGSLEDL